MSGVVQAPLVLTTKAGVAYPGELPAEVSVQFGIYPGVVLLDVTEANDSSGAGWLDKARLQQHIDHCTQLLALL